MSLLYSGSPWLGFELDLCSHSRNGRKKGRSLKPFLLNGVNNIDDYDSQLLSIYRNSASEKKKFLF